jgi:hypothetical protein
VPWSIGLEPCAGEDWSDVTMTDPDSNREKMTEARRAHDRLEEFSQRIDDHTIKSGDAALRNCLLINGGAAVAILAFMGSVISKNTGTTKVVDDIAGGLTYFAWGVITSVAALCLSYLVHFATYQASTSQKRVWEYPYVTPGKHTARWVRLKIALHVVAVALAVASAILFVIGLFAVQHAVISFAG